MHEEIFRALQEGAPVLTAGRRLAHATYYAPHGTDEESALNFAMDLTPLVADASLSIPDYVGGYISKFAADVRAKLTKRLGTA